MLSEVFYWILNMSITAGLIGLALLMLRLIRKIPRAVVYLLWSPVLLRLLIPVGIPSRYSLMNLLSRTLSKSVAVEGLSIPDVTMTNYVRAAETYFPITYQTARLEQAFTAFSVVWAVGALLAAGLLVFSYARSSKSVKRTLKPCGDYFLSSFAAAPFVCGILKPKIIFPADITGVYARHVLIHETIHVKRLDNLWRMLALLAACVHWFNPLIWLFVKLFFDDMELSCDEEAVRLLSTVERKEYALAMLNFAAKRSPAVSSAFGGSLIKRRIEHVLSYKTMSVIASLFFITFILVMLVVLMTNPSA